MAATAATTVAIIIAKGLFVFMSVFIRESVFCVNKKNHHLEIIFQSVGSAARDAISSRVSRT